MEILLLESILYSECIFVIDNCENLEEEKKTVLFFRRNTAIFSTKKKRQNYIHE